MPGLIPLLAYIVPVPVAWRFHTAILLTTMALFAFGAMRSVVTSRSWVFSGVEMLAIGAAAATVAYLVGWLLGSIAGIDGG